MRKYAVVLLIVLGLSTGAWAGLRACVSVSPHCPTCQDDVWLAVSAEVPGQCYVADIKTCIQGGSIVATIILDCDDCSGCTSIDQTVDLGTLCPGLYIAFVKIVANPPDCGCPDCCGPCGGCLDMPRLVAVGATNFRVTCANSCWPWWPWGGCCP
jgi:hypothetical protein